MNFEQPSADDMFEARYTLPDKKLVWNGGFSPSETKRNEKILSTNAELIMQCSREEGKELA